jgi:hypothetical protein
VFQAIINKDFDTFADITMKDSNQFHAVCLDTFPPNVYMNDTSHTIVNLIHAYNTASGKNKVSMEVLHKSSVKPVENSVGSLIICYISFGTINFPYFLPFSFPVLHVIEWCIWANI